MAKCYIHNCYFINNVCPFCVWEFDPKNLSEEDKRSIFDIYSHYPPCQKCGRELEDCSCEYVFKKQCKDCKGTGKYHGLMAVESCQTCKGSGKV